MVPDLSVMGDPSAGFIEYFTGSTGNCRRNCGGGWDSIGGTSIGSPLVSALVATAAQPVTSRASALSIPRSTQWRQRVSPDVTTGNNNQFNAGGYSAGIGYDMASVSVVPTARPSLAGSVPPSFSIAKSSFAVTGDNASAESTGPTVNATLHDANGNPIANALVSVTATAASGDVAINGAPLATGTVGSATTDLTSDANGLVSFNVASSIAQKVSVVVTYEGTSIYTTTLTFKAAAAAKATKPGAPSISKLVAIVGGFTLTLKAPAKTGGAAITSYQYSLNNGSRWVAIAKGGKVVTVRGLVKKKAYNVIARAVNEIGPSVASTSRRVVTRS